DVQQVADAGVDVGCCVPEDLGAVVAAIGCCGRVRDAPVDQPQVAEELRAHLADLVAQGDDVVEPAAGQGVQMAGARVRDVDAVVLTKDPYGVRVKVLFRTTARTGDVN